MAAKDAAIRHQIAKIGGNTLSATHDMAAVAAHAREGQFARFLRAVDPDGVLAEDERLRRAKAAQRAAMARLALQSAQTRRARKGDRAAPSGS